MKHEREGDGWRYVERGVGEQQDKKKKKKSLNWYIRGLNRNTSYKWELMNSLLSAWILTTIYTPASLFSWAAQHSTAREGTGKIRERGRRLWDSGLKLEIGRGKIG